MMTSRERWIAVLSRKKPDRVPMDYWATPEATQKLLKHLGLPDFPALVKSLSLDTPTDIGPAYRGPKPLPGTDEWGVGYRVADYGSGTYSETVLSPLAGFSTISEIENNYRFPNPDWMDYSVIPAQLKGTEDRLIRGGGSEPFLTYCKLRGLEQAYIDMIENPELCHWLLGKLYDHAYEHTRRILETAGGRVDISYVAEDMGSQEDLLFSPDQIRTYFLPHMKRMAKLVHDAGAKVFHHSDGAIRRILPEMIAVGIDILNPIQWRCKGMDRQGLKDDFGDKVVFHGGMDNQQTLPFGTMTDVENEVLDNLRILGAGGGYILAPCHNIQSVTPPENIVAMYRTCFANS
jgi:uroporphyrinogen decarboxylase